MKRVEQNWLSTVIRDYRDSDYDSLTELWRDTELAQPERRDDEASIRRCNKLGGRLLVMEDVTTGRSIGSSWMTWDGRRWDLERNLRRHPWNGSAVGDDR